MCFRQAEFPIDLLFPIFFFFFTRVPVFVVLLAIARETQVFKGRG